MYSYVLFKLISHSTLLFVKTTADKVAIVVKCHTCNRVSLTVNIHSVAMAYVFGAWGYGNLACEEIEGDKYVNSNMCNQ